VKLPEAIIDAVHAHLPGAPAAALLRDESVRGDDRRHATEINGKGRVRGQLLPQLLAKEALRQDDTIRVAEPLHDEITQAATHRIADKKRSGKHRHSRGDAENDGGVGAPVVGQAATGKLVDAHVT
jgi:hypothetical protein